METLRFKRAVGGCLLAVAAVLTTLLASGFLYSAHAAPTLVFDRDSETVIYAEDADLLWHPASLTKLMTAYLTFEALRDGRLTLDQKIPCSEHANAQQPSKIGLPVGADITVELALKAVIVKSANDASVMLAEAISGTEPAFVARMNATAQRLGMTRTVFKNANGLPDKDQVTTARDMGKLALAITKDFSNHDELFKMTAINIGKIKLRSHNDLLKTFLGTDGMKTGFICDSGYNIVASATRDGTRMFAVVLGQTSASGRRERTEKLLAHGFETLGWKKLFGAPTLAALPAQNADAESAASIRTQLRSGACGYRGGPKVAKQKSTKPQAAKPKATKPKATASQKTSQKSAQSAPKPAPAQKPQPKAN